jgi:hypothetical protein
MLRGGAFGALNFDADGEIAGTTATPASDGRGYNRARDGVAVLEGTPHKPTELKWDDENLRKVSIYACWYLWCGVRCQVLFACLYVYMPKGD